MMALDKLITPELKRDLEARSKLTVIDPDDDDDELHSPIERDKTERKDLAPNHLTDHQIDEDSLNSIVNNDH